MIVRHLPREMLLLILVMVSTVHSQNVPSILSQGRTVTAKVGDSVTLACQVDNLGSSKVTWTYVNHGTTIYHGGQLLAIDRTKYSILLPADITAYNLQILDLDAEDQGYYKCEIDGTDQSITIHLDIVGKPNIPLNVDPEILNKTECCASQNIHSTCLAACTPATFDQSKVLQCQGDIQDNVRIIVDCLSAGSNHESCCLFRNITPACLPFCRGQVPDLGTEHLDCLTPASLGIITKCATEGYATLPNEPQDVTVIPHSDGIANSLLVSWKPPTRNADKVTGYKIMYKRTDMQKYYTLPHDNSKGLFARLSGQEIVAGRGYDVHVAAIAQFGASSPSIEVTVFLPNASLIDSQAKDIDACCKNRKVSDDCRTDLCQSKTWANLNADSLGQCFDKLDDVFSCLVGEQDHRGCCNAFGVSPVCMPLCSGKPPAFNASLIVCVQQMAVVEACVQQGYEKLPKPPSHLQLEKVESYSATLKFEQSPSLGITKYIVFLKTGEEKGAVFDRKDVLLPSDSFVVLSNLMPNTLYSVHITAEKSSGGSLPSETVHFLTYPESLEPTAEPVINVPHNFSGCCYSKMPDVCAYGCQYIQNISAYYQKNLITCYAHIGSVLSCAADGRNHAKCCSRRNVRDPDCLDLCGLAKDGPLDPKYIKCLADTPKAIACFEEGLVNLPRYPDVFVNHTSQHTITLKWTHPETSSLIDFYVVSYKSQDDSKFTQMNTTKTYLILNNLVAGTQYEISVSSVNENGTSSPSPTIKQYTNEVPKSRPDFNQTQVTGRKYWANITECCHSSAISDKCRDQCLNKQLDPLGSDGDCVYESLNMLACYANGEDHGSCCEKSGVSSACVATCRGHTSDLSENNLLALCMGRTNREMILSCYLENSGLIPSIPTKLQVKPKTGLTVTIIWEKAARYCGDDCQSVLHYWKEDLANTPVDMVVKAGVTSPLDITVKSEGRYTFTVTARNFYGESRRSGLVTLYIATYDRDVKVLLLENFKLVPVGSNIRLACEISDFNPADTYSIRWFFNNGRELSTTSSDKRRLYLYNVDPKRDEGSYSCRVKDSVVEVTDTLFVPMQYAPRYTENRDETAAPNKGNKAKVACWFRGFPTTGSTNWVKDGKKITVYNSAKYLPGLDRRYYNGITAYRLKIANVVPSDFGVYSIEVSNDFGKSSCSIALKDPKDIVDIAPARKDPDPKGCCARNNVPALCQELCTLDIDVAETVKDPKYIDCLRHFNTLIKCGADGRDHRQCCQEKGVLPYCIPFCAGQSPASVLTNANELLNCVSESNTIFTCAKSGHTLLPYPPTNVQVNWWNSGSTIQVRWSRPQFNHDRISSYIIYYHSTSRNVEQHHSVNEHLTEFYIQKPVTSDTYYVTVAAHNKFGYSLRSDVFTLKPRSQEAPFDVRAVISGTTATVSWSAPSGSDQSSATYNLYYKRKNASRYLKVPDIRGTSYILSALRENSEYSIYVSTVSSQDEESGPSSITSFTTGAGPTPTPTQTTKKPGTPGPVSKASSGGDSDSNVGIGIGVTVALLALIAIVIILLYVVRTRNCFKRSNNEAVSFDNNISGSQVQIQSEPKQFQYGRMQEDNMYHNAASPTAADPHNTNGAYENPSYSADKNSGGKPDNFATIEVTNSEV